MGGLTTLVWDGDNVGMNNTETDVLLNMFLLLYADHTVICSETPGGLQKGLNTRMKLL